MLKAKALSPASPKRAASSRPGSPSKTPGASPSRASPSRASPAKSKAKAKSKSPAKKKPEDLLKSFFGIEFLKPISPRRIDVDSSFKVDSDGGKTPFSMSSPSHTNSPVRDSPSRHNTNILPDLNFVHNDHEPNVSYHVKNFREPAEKIVALAQDGKLPMEVGWMAHKMNTSFESERNRLLSVIYKDKRCIKCSVIYKQTENSQNACSHHNGQVKYYSCSSCGNEKYYSCCGKCDNCSRGCVKTPHCSYD